jgi:hypothetical protein
MDLYSVPVIFGQARTLFQARNVALFRNCSERICGHMALDLA